MKKKSLTDVHWNERAAGVENDVDVNISDIFQRELEYNFICKNLNSKTVALEVGCGNGYSTERFRSIVKYVDAFDYSENMIARAKTNVGELNNRFYLDDILSPKYISNQYDVVICVRVLINLKNIEEQRIAINNLLRFVKNEGLLILVEGFSDGFKNLNSLRQKVGLPSLKPAIINFYSSMKIILRSLEKHFTIEDKFHLGAYDYLTRIVYPLIVGPENVKHNTVFSEKCSHLAQAYNADCFEPFSRIRGFLLRKHSTNELLPY